jgi:predicted DNA-binding transcriptional regulator AlpA
MAAVTSKPARGQNVADDPSAQSLPAGVGYLTVEAAALFTSLSKSYLDRLRCVGGGPKYARIGRHAVRYAVDDLRAWMEARSVANTAQGYALVEGVSL